SAHNQQLPPCGRLVRVSQPSAPEATDMSRIRCARMLSLTVVAALPLGALAPSCSTGVSTAGQRIICADHGAGPVDCRPMASTGSGSGSGAGSGSDTCEDIDEDGDGPPSDEGEHDGDARATGAVRGHDGA